MSPQSLHLSPWCFPSTRATNPPHYASDVHICFDPFSHSCQHILTSVALFALQDKMEALGEYERKLFTKLLSICSLSPLPSSQGTGGPLGPQLGHTLSQLCAFIQTILPFATPFLPFLPQELLLIL